MTAILHDFPGYLIHEDGTIEAIEKMAYNKLTKSYRRQRGRILKQKTTNRGYKAVTLVRTDLVRKEILVHRIMILAFHKQLTPGLCVRHLDGDKTNNHLYNLEEGTYSQNNIDNHPDHPLIVKSHNGYAVYKFYAGERTYIGYRKTLEESLKLQEYDPSSKHAS